MDDEWALGNQMLMTNTPNARPITRELRRRAVRRSRGRTSRASSTTAASTSREAGHAFNKALYLSDSWRINKWLLDASVRYENQEATNRVCNLTNVDLDGNPLTHLQQRRARVQRHARDHGLRRGLHVVDGGRELQLHRLHVRLCPREPRRALPGLRQRHPRQHHGQYATRSQVIDNYEVGFKFENDLLYADISAYYRDFTGLAYQQTDGAGAPTGSQARSMAPSRRASTSSAALTRRQLPLPVVANYLDGEYTDFDACFPFTNVVTGNGCAPIEGQQLQRQPKLRYMLTPSYTLPLPWGDIEAYVTYTHVGDHTQDQSGLQQLGTYETWDFGIAAADRRELAVQPARHERDRRARPHGSNSRIFGTAAGTGGVIAGAPARGQRDQLPGEVPLVIVIV